MAACPFCAIAGGTLAAPLIYADERVLAFLDHAPYGKGHVLVVPRRHYPDLVAMPPDEVGDLFRLAQRVGRACLEALDADGFHLGLNNGKAARQVVFHAHVHIIPRWHGDGMDFSTRRRFSAAEQEQVRAALAGAVQAPA